ncbi:Rho termination factor N-terminal domain-containing protein [Pseudoalteromonas sp. MMG022]|uniref:Rho termination factor N-terminal domain-containing protein n=1 Tax=Pseudoalteromonas sp. MMG022 TaxID=2909978 RepID=UPI001F3DA588|nr:Rho termination factor N-terminal domain-containing protein [Pseudoalteromonas sp. MMG022]MCF6437177.1 Rho termination factor N-terminal domain-containing protein [Pseudoalteromonas sp. MMG022]
MNKTKLEKSLKLKSREELVILAREFNIKGGGNARKGELISLILKEDEKVLTEKLQLSWWKVHREQVFGWASLIGLIIAVITLLPLNDAKTTSNLQVTKSKELYEQGEVAFSEIYGAYDYLIERMNNGYLLSEAELVEAAKKYHQAIESFEFYSSKIKRYGNSKQVEIVNGIQSWLWEDYRQLELQQAQVRTLQQNISTILFRNTQSKEDMEELASVVSDGITKLISFENNLYFSARDYNLNVLKKLESYLTHEFREVLDLGTENSLIEDINQIPALVSASNSYKYDHEAIPFVLAENRKLFSATAKIEGDLGPLKLKDDSLRFQAAQEFLFETIESNKKLKEHMLALKKAHESKPETEIIEKTVPESKETAKKGTTN